MQSTALRREADRFWCGVLSLNWISSMLLLTERNVAGSVWKVLSKSMAVLAAYTQRLSNGIS
jgi:hypothetical protein